MLWKAIDSAGMAIRGVGRPMRRAARGPTLMILAWPQATLSLATTVSLVSSSEPISRKVSAMASQSRQNQRWCSMDRWRVTFT